MSKVLYMYVCDAMSMRLDVPLAFPRKQPRPRASKMGVVKAFEAVVKKATNQCGCFVLALGRAAPAASQGDCC